MGDEPVSRLSHIDAAGAARMVDVSAKPVAARSASAQASVLMRPDTAALIADGAIGKGDVFAAARLAGIMAAKRVPELIPLCHTLPLDAVDLHLDCRPEQGVVEVTASCRVTAKTGAEMEALTAAAVAALTIYDMCKAADRGMRITDLRLIHKSGGTSGDFAAD